MSFYRKSLAIIAFFIVLFTAGAWMISAKSSILGPKIAACPTALNGFFNLLSELTVEKELTQDIWDCAIGGLLYLAVPGIGIAWIVGKKISD